MSANASNHSLQTHLNWRLGILLFLFVAISSVYSVVTPAFETPDEIWHFAFIQHLATGQGLPVSEPNTTALWRQQGVQAPLFYIASAILTAGIDQRDFSRIYERANPHAAIGRSDALANRNYLVHHNDEKWPWHGSILALHLTRLFSVFLGAVALWAIYQTLNLLRLSRFALLSTAFIAFIPQFVFISAAASNDNAINALAALVLWRLVAITTAPRKKQTSFTAQFIAVGILLGLALLSKLSALSLLPLVALTVIFTAWRARSWRVFFAGGVAIAIPAVLIAGWWYVRNWTLYQDLLAWNVWQANILLRVAPANLQTILNELPSLEHSFWGVFGWLNVPFPDWVYTIFRAVEMMIAIGLLINLVSWLKNPLRLSLRVAAAGLLLLWLALLAFSWWRFMIIAPAAQGRYFFPAAPSLALLFSFAVTGWARWWKQSIFVWRGVIGCFLALTILAPWTVVAPAYQPPPSLSSAGLMSIDANLEDQFAIRAVAASPTRLNPGQTATITVTWQALVPSSEDYSVFVHFVNEDGLTIAQMDTMPGGGLLPTSTWKPGEIYTEAYRVKIPQTAYTPDHGQWAVGFYNHRSGERLAFRTFTPQAGFFVSNDSLIFGSAELNSFPGRVPNPIAFEFQDNVTLAGYSLSGRVLQPGQPITVTLFWQARGPIREKYTIFVHLLDSAFETRGGHDSVPSIPTHAWESGQIITDTHTFLVSPLAAAGEHQLEIGLYTTPSFDRLGTLQSAGAEGADRFLLNGLRVR